MTRPTAILGPFCVAALVLFCAAVPPSSADPVPAPPPALPAWPKDIADPLLGARIRVNSTSGIRRADNFPVPLTASGMPDVTMLLGPGFDGLEFSAGFHSLTIILPQPQIVGKVGFLDRTAEGSFTAFLSASDPQLLTQTPAAQTSFQGPDTAQAALFQPQPAAFVQLEFHLAKPGKLARIAVYGPAADTDYVLTFPPGAAVPAGVKKSDVDVAALGSGARVWPISSGRPGADPAALTGDALGSAYVFPDSDPAPSFDIDLQGFRRADRAVLFLSAPPSKIEVVKIPRPPALPSGDGLAIVARASGDVQTLNFDGTEMHPIRPGDPLPIGRTLNVGYDAVADLEIDGTSFLRVGPNSNVVLRAAGKGGTEVSLLRGSLLWQVYGPGGGGELLTPSLAASVTGGVAIAETELGGESRIGLLGGTPGGVGGPGPVAIRDPLTGGYFRPLPGEGATLAAPGGMGATVLGIKPFSVATWWRESRIGARAGGLHGEAEKGYFFSPLPAPAGDLLGVATSPGGLNPVQIPFPEQPLEAVRFRITPLVPGPVVVAKVLVLGLYAPQEVALAYRPGPALSAPAPAPGAASAPPPLPPVPAASPATAGKGEPPASPAPPPAAAAPMPAPAPIPAPPISPAPAASKSGYTAESSSIASPPSGVYAGQNSKGDPHLPHP